MASGLLSSGRASARGGGPGAGGGRLGGQAVPQAPGPSDARLSLTDGQQASNSRKDQSLLSLGQGHLHGTLDGRPVRPSRGWARGGA